MSEPWSGCRARAVGLLLHGRRCTEVMADTTLGQSDDLSFIAGTTEQVQKIYSAYRQGKLPLSSELVAALSQTREQLVAIKLDGSANPLAADQRIAACVQIVQILREAPSDVRSDTHATSPREVQPEAEFIPSTMPSASIPAEPVLDPSPPPPPPSPPVPLNYPSVTSGAPAGPPPSWSMESSQTWIPPAVRNPGMPSNGKPKLRLSNVVIGLVCAFAILFIAPAIVIPLVVGGSHTHTTAPQASASASSGQIVPSLDSLLSNAPAQGLVIDSRSNFNGYLNQTQIQQLIGTALPSGTQVYASTWIGPTGAAIIEAAVLTPNNTDAVDFATGYYSTIASHSSHQFAIPGLAGVAGGVTVTPTGDQKPKALASVARSRVGLLFIAVADDMNTAQTLAIQAATTAGASLPVDPGSL